MISLIVLLYNAEESVPALFEAVLKQKHPQHANQSDWLDVWFMDNASRDHTAQALQTAIEKAGSPKNLHLVSNPANIGLAGNVNKAFSLIQTPFGLTCHADVLFASENYVAGMFALMTSHSDAGAITGQPRIPEKTEIPTAEKFNLIGNLMDVFPKNTQKDLIPVGFAEGRCDIFRVEALRKVGFWDTTLHTCGEDQLMAARMREAGYQIYQAPQLHYYLSVSDEQNSICKLLKHAHLFGRTTPYILLSGKAALKGISGDTSGDNRQTRKFWRLTHLAGVPAVFLALCGLFSGLPPALALTPLMTVMLAKFVLLEKHLMAVPMSGKEWVKFLGFLVLQDFYYTAGFVQGLWMALRSSKEKPIR